MRKFLALFLILSITALAGAAFARDVHVNGYTRQDGTYVQPHQRSAPDGNFNNNWSTKGNINPYTGQPGTKTQPSYNSNPYGGSGGYSPYGTQQQKKNGW